MILFILYSNHFRNKYGWEIKSNKYVRKKLLNFLINNIRFLSQKTDIVQMTTIGNPHSFSSFQLSDGSLVSVKILDTAGQEKFRSLSRQYYKQADGCLLVYDITDKHSFEELQSYFLKEIQDNCKPEIKIILLGNKSDLGEQRQVNPEDGADFALKNGFTFLETSCLKNSNVADGFETLIELVYRDKLEKNNGDEGKGNITIKSSTTKESGCFC